MDKDTINFCNKQEFFHQFIRSDFNLHNNHLHICKMRYITIFDFFRIQIERGRFQRKRPLSLCDKKNYFFKIVVSTSVLTPLIVP